MRLSALSASVDTPIRCFSGVIHSVFHHACNVSLEDDALITFVSSDKGNPAQGIRLMTPSTFTFLNQLGVGQPVACRGGILRISGSELSVDLRTASLWHIDLKGLQIDLHQPDTAQAWAAAWLELLKHRSGSGIFAMIAGIPATTQYPGIAPIETLAERAVETISVLIDATHHLEVDAVIAAFRPLIGLGPGLTPSGDDFIVGYLTGLWSTAGNDSSRLRFISSLGAWLSQASTGTNAISRTYMKSAVNGNVSEPIATLAQRVGQGKGMASVRQATRIALQVGHTSGADGVLGLLLGLSSGQAPSCLRSDLCYQALYISNDPQHRLIPRFIRCA
jgi:Protein of unknown function (DUF2877)